MDGKVRSNDVRDGMDMQSDEMTTYVHRPTGRVITVSDEAMQAAEDGDEDDVEPDEPLPRSVRQKSVRTRQVDLGLIVDFAANGKPIGIEITAPEQLTLAALNRVLREPGCAPVRRADLAPLRAA